MSTLIWLMLLAFSNVVNTEDLANNNNAVLPKSIFLLAGQSNMAGRGGLIFGKWDGYVPPECAPNPRILRLNAARKWEEAHEPLHYDIDVTKVCGIGPGMSFANSVLKSVKETEVIGLVPCAVGGTNITQWSRGTELYNSLVARAQAALQNGGGKIEAMLWYQGEADTDNQEHAELHEQRFEKFVDDIRLDLKLPTLPIIQVALVSGLNWTNVCIIRDRQLNARVPYVTTVHVFGLEFNGDKLHLNRDSEVKLGQALAKTFLNNVSNSQGQDVVLLNGLSQSSLPSAVFLPNMPLPPLPSVELAPHTVAPPSPTAPGKSYATKSFQIYFLDFLLGWILSTYIICVGF